MKYKLKDEFSSLPPERLVTQLAGEKQAFTLHSQPLKRTRPATSQGPAKEVVIPTATQAQLKKLHDIGSKLVEEVSPVTGKQNS